VLHALPDQDSERPIPNGTTVGHVHLHVADLESALNFYRDVIGFEIHTRMDQIGMIDMHAGGRFPHRLAFNVWQGRGAPQRPAGTAGMRHFTIRFDTPVALAAALRRAMDSTGPADQRSAASGTDPAEVRDPAGNVVHLTV
jgi:catechol 2,3-dioxygenase